MHNGDKTFLKGFIFQNGNFDGDIGVRFHIGISERLPIGPLVLDGADMPPRNGDLILRGGFGLGAAETQRQNRHNG